MYGHAEPCSRALAFVLELYAMWKQCVVWYIGTIQYNTLYSQGAVAWRRIYPPRQRLTGAGGEKRDSVQDGGDQGDADEHGRGGEVARYKLVGTVGLPCLQV